MAGIAGFTVSNDCEEDARRVIAMWDLMADASNSGPASLYQDDEVLCAFDRANVSIEYSTYLAEDIAVWLDGEIYDFGGKLADLEPESNSAATIAALYRRDGLPFFKSVDGIFAAAIYDRVRKELHLVNDRYGLRHLYVWKPARGGVVWASRVRAFLEAPGFKPRIDRSALSNFIDIGYLLENQTWFEDVTLLPSGSVLTWNLRAGCATQRQYWWWDRIVPLTGRLDEDEIAEELGSRFVRAVERRVGPGDGAGLCLSGGLDSRAILAAMPSWDAPFHTITFGRDGCPDRVFAARAAAVRGAENHQFELDESNWLLPRVEGVWLSDGQHDLMHMHGIEAADLIRRHFKIDMSGFGGDSTLGGSYLLANALDRPISAETAAEIMWCDPDRLAIDERYKSLAKADYYFLQNRVRRFVYGGVVLSNSEGLPCRLPFYDNGLMELAYSLPDALRYKSHIYRRMLLNKFPDYYKAIPWQKTGVPIGYPDWFTKVVEYGRRGRRKLSRLTGGMVADPYASQGFADYDGWMRSEPARSFLGKLFRNSQARYAEYLPVEAVESCWQSHLGGKNNAQVLCRYATFEIWLQQVFEKNMRPAKLESLGI
jgi:asparagine synthase (glutamine-hydrolysing)